MRMLSIQSSVIAKHPPPLQAQRLLDGDDSVSSIGSISSAGYRDVQFIFSGKHSNIFQAKNFVKVYNFDL